MKLVFFLIGFSVFLIYETIGAQELNQAQPGGARDAQNEIFSTVVIEGLKNPATQSYAKLLRGIDAFRLNHNLSPNAELRFQLVDRTVTTVPLRIKVESIEKSIQIPIQPDGFFSIPTPAEFGSREGDIVSNRRAGDLLVRVVVRSPGSTDSSYRFGDVRLHCEVRWAMDKEDASLILRAIDATSTGVCKTPRVRWSEVMMVGRLIGAELVENGTRVKIPVDQLKNSFSPPLSDQSWSNNATLHFTFETEQATDGLAMSPATRL